MKENKLTHIIDAIARRSDLVTRGGRGRPKLTLVALVQKDVGLLDITEHDHNRAQWSRQIHVADPN